MSKREPYAVEVSNPARSPVSVARIRHVASGVLAKLCRPGLRRISIAFVTGAAMRRLNRTRRGIDRTTDVLSFFLGAAEGDAVNGEVVLCYPYLKAQAQRVGVSVREEVIRMLVHGILHLAGYDHETKKDAGVMFPIQERMVAEFL